MKQSKPAVSIIFDFLSKKQKKNKTTKQKSLAVRLIILSVFDKIQNDINK